jgi:hypothetical protein
MKTLFDILVKKQYKYPIKVKHKVSGLLHTIISSDESFVTLTNKLTPGVHDVVSLDSTEYAEVFHVHKKGCTGCKKGESR